MVASYFTWFGSQVGTYTGWNYISSTIKGYNQCPNCQALKNSVSCTPNFIMPAPLSGRAFLRIAGITGSLAVAFGAYGAHVFSQKEVPRHLKEVYETANRYHMFHSLVLLAVPLARRPNVTGTLILAGMFIFCGSCYFHALTGSTEIRRITPFGGILLMIGWLTFAL